MTQHILVINIKNLATYFSSLNHPQANFSKHSTGTFTSALNVPIWCFEKLASRWFSEPKHVAKFMILITNICCVTEWINYCIVNTIGWLLSKHGNIHDIIMQIAGLLLMTSKPYHAITSLQNIVVIHFRLIYLGVSCLKFWSVKSIKLLYPLSYWVSNLDITFREDHGLQVLENKVVRKMFGF